MSVRQLHPLDSVTPSAGKVKNRRQPFTRHTGNSVQKKWTNLCALCSATRRAQAIECDMVQRVERHGVE